MCLDKLKPVNKNIKTVYKILVRFTYDDTGVYRTPFQCAKVSVGKTYKDKSKKDIETLDINPDFYPTGFHCFVNKSDAIKVLDLWGTKIIAEVEVDNIVACGKEHYILDKGRKLIADIVVARTMKVIKIEEVL